MKSVKSKSKMYIFIFILFLLSIPFESGAVDKAELFVFFKDLCDACHGANPEHNIIWAREGYEHSGHKNNGNALYANSDGCQQCHTHEGFLEFIKSGKVDPKAVVKTPTQPGCNTCHDPHKKGDMSLRNISPTTLANNESYDLGNSNLCANCHHVSGKATDTVKPLPANKIPSYWGPHHGPQSDMLLGTNAFEFPDKKYYSSVHATLTKTGCIACHMGYPEKRYGFSPALSGHSFNIMADVHGTDKLNTSGCLGSCHKEIKQVKGKEIYDYEAKADFDNDGTIEHLQEEIEGLLDLFVNKEGSGYLQKGKIPMYKQDGSWNWTRAEDQRPLNEVAALYNYKYVLEDRSKGIHNAPYAIQILYDSIEALDSDFDVSKRNAYRPPEEYKP